MNQFKRCIAQKRVDAGSERSLRDGVYALQYLDFSIRFAEEHGGYIDSCCSKLSSDHKILVKAANPNHVIDDADNGNFTFIYQPYTFSQFSMARFKALEDRLTFLSPMNKSCVLERRAMTKCFYNHCSEENTNYGHCSALRSGWDGRSECRQNYENYNGCYAPVDHMSSRDRRITSAEREDFNDFISDLCQVRIAS